MKPIVPDPPDPKRAALAKRGGWIAGVVVPAVLLADRGWPARWQDGAVLVVATIVAVVVVRLALEVTGPDTTKWHADRHGLGRDDVRHDRGPR